MNEIKTAWRKRIESTMNSSGWNTDTGSPDINAVRFWFYSVSIHTGPRFVGQCSADFYRDLQSGGGCIGTLKADKQNAGDMLTGALRKYDEQPESKKNIVARGNVFGYLGNYARETKTWGVLPTLNESCGLHFIVFDWVTDGGTHVITPMAVQSEGILPADEISAMASLRLGFHLAKNPQEVPKGFS